MPQVGEKHFAYTQEGKAKAKAYAQKVGKKVKNTNSKKHKTMKQGYDARLDESLGASHGKKSQSYKSRRHESAAMEKKYYGHKYGSDAEMGYRNNFGHHADVIKGSHVSDKISHLIRK